MEDLAFIGIVIGAIVVGIIVIGVIMTTLYQRASKEQSFVRTGMGGQKVVKDGGALILPVFHETIPINMQTLRLSVERKAKDSLITKDRLRVDIKAEFYVRVSPDADSIAAAAQTLGQRTMDPRALSELIEGKFVDVLRAVAAGMDMQELHEQRADFVRKVQTTVSEDLKKNGLELESVSLTGLDQTSREHFNEGNAFDAEGLKKLTEVTELRRKERNEIEQTTRVAVEQKNFEANKQSLEIKQGNEFARLEQEREIETRKAAQEAELTRTRAERQKEAEAARIAAERAIEQAQIEKEQAIKVAQTQAARDLELAQQEQRIAVASKSEEESKARAAADEARAEAVKASEQVKTVEATATAERQSRIQVIAAEAKAQEEAAQIRIRAEAELAAADAQAKAKERLVEADAKRYDVEAEGQRQINEAANLMSPEQAALQVRLKLIDQLPAILAEMNKPIEKIDSFKVVSVQGGAFGGGQDNSSGFVDGQTVPTSGNLPSAVTQSLLDYRMRVPFVDELARTIGLDLSAGMNGIVGGAGQPLTEGSAAIAPSPEPTAIPSTRATRGPKLTPEEKAELQKLAGINDKG